MTEKICFHFFSVAIDLILFVLACNEDMHNILDEFKFQPIGSLTVAFEYLKKIVALWATCCFCSKAFPFPLCTKERL